MNELNVDDIFGGDTTAISKLCDLLNDIYPQVNPTPSDDDRLILYRAGQRSVVEFILSNKTNV